MTILDTMKTLLIGKTIRVCTYSKVLTCVTKIKIKKSPGTTIKQFKSNDPSFFRFVNIEKVIGYHRIFDNIKIVDVYTDSGEIYLNLENGDSTMLTDLIFEQNINNLTSL